MFTFEIDALELEEMSVPDGPSVRFNFPVFAKKGSNDSAVVVFEIEPGGNLGMHTDSQEEIVLVLEGTGEGTVGEETGKLGAGVAVVIPAMVPHDFRNVGETTLRAIGFFSGSVVYSEFTPSPVEGSDALVVVHGKDDRVMAGTAVADS